MPHFVIDYSKDILEIQDPNSVLLQVHTDAKNSELFDELDIKVRLNPFMDNYLVGEKKWHLFMFLLILWKVELQTKKQNFQSKLCQVSKPCFQRFPVLM